MTKFLDLDAVQPEVDFTIKLNGKEHKLKVATISTFIENTKAMESLGVNASSLEEIEVTIGIILRSFPTMTRKDLEGLNLEQIKRISDFAREANGEKTEVASEGEAGKGETEAS